TNRHQARAEVASFLTARTQTIVAALSSTLASALHAVISCQYSNSVSHQATERTPLPPRRDQAMGFRDALIITKRTAGCPRCAAGPLAFRIRQVHEARNANKSYNTPGTRSFFHGSKVMKLLCLHKWTLMALALALGLGIGWAFREHAFAAEKTKSVESKTV